MTSNSIVIHVFKKEMNISPLCDSSFFSYCFICLKFYLYWWRSKMTLLPPYSVHSHECMDTLVLSRFQSCFWFHLSRKQILQFIGKNWGEDLVWTSHLCLCPSFMNEKKKRQKHMEVSWISNLYKVDSHYITSTMYFLYLW